MATITSKTEFLQVISDRLGRPCPTELPRFKRVNTISTTHLTDRSPEDLLTILKEKAKTIHTQIIESTKKELSTTIAAFIRKNSSGKIMLSTDKQFEIYGLEELYQSTEWDKHQVVKWRPELSCREENIKNASESDLAIVFGDYLLAESGSVSVESRPGQGRSLHFLPSRYLAIVPLSRLLPRSTQLAHIYDQKARQSETIGSAINLISGPSNSGDIEMILVVGVHGPLEVSYLIIKDC